jgi:hypothetical protein
MEKKQTFEILKDTAIILGVVSIISYYFSFSFERGIKEYYGISDVSTNEITISSTINTVYELSPLIFLLCILLLVSNILTSFIIFIYKVQNEIMFYLLSKIKYYTLNLSKTKPELSTSEKYYNDLINFFNMYKEKTYYAFRLMYTFIFVALGFLLFLPKYFLGLQIEEYSLIFSFLLLCIIISFNHYFYIIYN